MSNDFIVCRQCSRSNPVHFAFCLGCGAELGAQSPFADAPATTPPDEGMSNDAFFADFADAPATTPPNEGMSNDAFFADFADASSPTPSRTRGRAVKRLLPIIVAMGLAELAARMLATLTELGGSFYVTQVSVNLGVLHYGWWYSRIHQQLVPPPVWRELLAVSVLATLLLWLPELASSQPLRLAIFAPVPFYVSASYVLRRIFAAQVHAVPRSLPELLQSSATASSQTHLPFVPWVRWMPLLFVSVFLAVIVFVVANTLVSDRLALTSIGLGSSSSDPFVALMNALYVGSLLVWGAWFFEELRARLMPPVHDGSKAGLTRLFQYSLLCMGAPLFASLHWRGNWEAFSISSSLAMTTMLGCMVVVHRLVRLSERQLVASRDADGSSPPAEATGQSLRSRFEKRQLTTQSGELTLSNGERLRWSHQQIEGAGLHFDLEHPPAVQLSWFSQRGLGLFLNCELRAEGRQQASGRLRLSARLDDAALAAGLPELELDAEPITAEQMLDLLGAAALLDGRLLSTSKTEEVRVRWEAKHSFLVLLRSSLEEAEDSLATLCAALSSGSPALSCAVYCAEPTAVAASLTQRQPTARARFHALSSAHHANTSSELLTCIVSLGDQQVLQRSFGKRQAVGIGRSADNELSLSHHSVSRRHARISFEQGAWRIIDLSSGNGTYVNSENVHQHNLNAGDRVRIGDFQIRIQLGSETAAISAPLSVGDPSDAVLVLRPGPSFDTPQLIQLAGRARRILVIIMVQNEPVPEALLAIHCQGEQKG